jgi:long-subunit fatty acid transport protein
MSHKNLFTKSALAVAVAIVSTQAWSAGFNSTSFLLLVLAAPIPAKALLQMTRATSAATRR